MIVLELIGGLFCGYLMGALGWVSWGSFIASKNHPELILRIFSLWWLIGAIGLWSIIPIGFSEGSIEPTVFMSAILVQIYFMPFFKK